MGGDSYFYSKPGSNGGNGNAHKELLQILREEIARIPQLAYDEEIKIAREMAKEQKGTKRYAELKNQLVNGKLKFVLVIAQKFSNKPAATLNLFSEGVEGLIIGVEKYDPERGSKLSTYVSYLIRERMQSFVKRDRTIKIPFSILEKYHKIREAKKEIEQEGEAAYAEDIAEITGYGVKMVNSVLRTMNHCSSLDYVLDNEYSAKDLIKDSRVATPFDELSETEVKMTIDDLLKKNLLFREREIIKLCYDIEGNGRMTLEEIGKIFKVTRERVRQIRENARLKLRPQNPGKTRDFC